MLHTTRFSAPSAASNPVGLPSTIFPFHRYPKDIWPGHKPPNHTAGVGEANGIGGEGAAEEEEQLEFFCDACDETIPTGVERMECAVCPDEFCLCHRCFDEGEVRGSAVICYLGRFKLQGLMSRSILS